MSETTKVEFCFEIIITSCARTFDLNLIMKIIILPTNIGLNSHLRDWDLLKSCVFFFPLSYGPNKMTHGVLDPRCESEPNSCVLLVSIVRVELGLAFSGLWEMTHGLNSTLMDASCFFQVFLVRIFLSINPSLTQTRLTSLTLHGLSNLDSRFVSASWKEPEYS